MDHEDTRLSASEIRKLMEDELHRPITLSKVMRLMDAGNIPSEKSLLDRRKRIARRSDVMKWIEEARQQEDQAALAFA